MLTNDFSVSSQLVTPITIGTKALADCFESCDRFSKIEFQKYGIIGTKSFENLLDPISTTVMATDIQKLDNNLNDSYSIHEQNYDVNLAFHMSPTVQMSGVPSTFNAAYVNTFNNNIILKNCNNKRSNGWKNYLSKPQGIEKDENKSQTSKDKSKDTNSTKHKIPRSTGRNPFEHTTVYNNYRYGNFPNVFTNNFHLAHHHSTNNFNRSRFQMNNGKRSRKEYKPTNSDDIVRRVHGLMERFTSKAGLFQINRTSILNENKQFASLDKDIWDLFVKKAQSQNTYFHKLELWKKIYLHIAKLFDRYGLFMVGSTMSGLGTEGSDIDMCLLLRTASNDPRADAVRCLELIRNSLLNCDFVKTPEVIHAKVPILKFKSSEHGFEIDLNCNNSVGIRNTHLLHCYAQLDWRVRPLIIIVKLWAQANCINDAKNMTISSYSLALMVIHYLQCGVTPPLIPCLHGLYGDKFSPEKEIHDIDIQEELPKFYSDNNQSMGELLLGFLKYYTSFNYDIYAISVRLASRLLIDNCRYNRSPKNDPHQWKYLCIEEPFDLTNTARSVYDLQTFKRIQRVFEMSHQKLSRTQNIYEILTNLEANQR